MGAGEEQGRGGFRGRGRECLLLLLLCEQRRGGIWGTGVLFVALRSWECFFVVIVVFNLRYRTAVAPTKKIILRLAALARSPEAALSCHRAISQCTRYAALFMCPNWSTSKTPARAR